MTSANAYAFSTPGAASGAPQQTLAAPRFDRAVLDANTMSDPSLQRELFELFFDQMPGHFERLRAGDGVSAWRTVGHAIKGTARTLGLLELAETALAVERASAPSADLLDALIDAESAGRAAAAAYMATVT